MPTDQCLELLLNDAAFSSHPDVGLPLGPEQLLVLRLQLQDLLVRVLLRLLQDLLNGANLKQTETIFRVTLFI